MIELFKKYWWILLAGLLIRVILAMTTFHSDIRHFDLAGLVVSSGYLTDLYDFAKASEDTLALLNRNNLFNYPPLIYHFNGVWSTIFTGFVTRDFVIQFLSQTDLVLEDTRIFFHLLFLKLPYLIFDFIILYSLLRIFQGKKEKLISLVLWVFNPVNLYATYMVGQFDIIPTAFVTLSLLLISLKKPIFSALSLGFGAAFKLFPFFLLIPLAITQDSWSKRIKIILIGVLPYLIPSLLYLFSPGFRETALFASQSDKSFYAQILVSGGESILLFPLFLVSFYLVLFYKRENNNFEPSINSLWPKYFIILLLFFILTHFHAQWFLWLTPLLIIDLVKTNFKHLLLTIILLATWFSSLFFFEPSLTVGIFSPVWPSLLSVPSIWQQLGIKVDYNFARSVIQTTLAAASLTYIYIYFPKKNE